MHSFLTTNLQAIIGNYAVPILEEKAVWGTTDATRTAYMDSTDVARLTLAALRYCGSCVGVLSVSSTCCTMHGRSAPLILHPQERGIHRKDLGPSRSSCVEHGGGHFAL